MPLTIKPQTFLILIASFILGCNYSGQESMNLQIFESRLLAEESYIGFYAAENRYIREQTPEYLSARSDFFLAIGECEEDPEEFIEEFIAICRQKDLLNEADVEAWEETLVILSYELYPNKPIFNYTPSKVISHRDIVFAKYPNKELTLDLFLPGEPLKTSIPCVIAIHGGGWTVNRKIWFEPFAAYLADNGIAAVTIDYRMLPAVTIRDCVYDSKAAVRWVRANAENYNIDPDRIGALGASAGAHLVALLGTSADVEQLEGSGGNPHVSSAVQAVVGIATPAFRSVDNRFAKAFGLSASEVQAISPYEYISANDPPLFLIHGTTDEVVPPEDSQALYDQYVAVGAYAKIHWIEDEGHGFYEGNDRGISLATDFFKEQFALQTAATSE